MLDGDWSSDVCSSDLTVEMRPSKAGNYLSLTCVIRATSKPQLDALYRELTAHPWVKIVL
jgi:putative lipoic acid-binding regulatory protein